MESRLIQPDQTKPDQAGHRALHRAANARGFSMLELLVVVAIALVIMAIAVPQMMTTLNLTKWRGEISDLSGVFQTCRSQAVKKNTSQQLNFTTENGQAVVYIDVPGSTSTSLVGKSQVWMFSHFQQAPTAPTGVNPTPLTKGSMWGGTDTTLPDTTDNLCFNSRGIPCICPGTPNGYCTSITNGYAFYFTQGSQWAAVGVSPAGRIKTFFWNGTAWAN